MCSVITPPGTLRQVKRTSCPWLSSAMAVYSIHSPVAGLKKGSADTAPTASARRMDPLRRLFEQARDLLVRLDGRFTEMPGAAFGLIRQLGGQRPVGPAPVAAGGQLDDRGPGQRVAEDQPAGAIVDAHQPSLLGGSEVFDLLLPGGGLQDAKVSAAVQHCEQEQPAGRCGQS